MQTKPKFLLLICSFVFILPLFRFFLSLRFNNDAENYRNGLPLESGIFYFSLFLLAYLLPYQDLMSVKTPDFDTKFI